MAGLKFKIAHKRAGSENWNVSSATQTKRTVRFLREVILGLEGRQGKQR